MEPTISSTVTRYIPIPSVGDALHIAMRLRDGQLKEKHRVSSCYVPYDPRFYTHFSSTQFAQSGQVPGSRLHEYFKNESTKSLRVMAALLKHPDWQGVDEHLSE